MHLPASYQNGFAPRDGEPLFPNLWQGCVGAWHPGLGPTGGVLRDWSSRQNHGTLTNMDTGTDWVASQYGYSLDLDGSNDLVQIESGLLTAFPIAVGLWFRGSSAAAFQSFFSCGENTVENHISLGFANKKVTWSPRRSLVDVSLASPANYDDGNWHHTVGVSSAANSHQLYVDGRLVASNSINLSTFPTLNRAAVGCLRRNTNASFFLGNTQDLRVYNRALDAEEISLLATRPGIAYELAPRHMTRQQLAAYRRRMIYAQTIGSGVI